MAHKWERLPETREKVCKYGWSPVRRCVHCGKMQTREANTVWQRVVSYQWWPLVGRCKGDVRAGKG